MKEKLIMYGVEVTGKAIIDGDIPLDLRSAPGTSVYDMPAADKYCKANGKKMSEMTDEDWEPFFMFRT